MVSIFSIKTMKGLLLWPPPYIWVPLIVMACLTVLGVELVVYYAGELGPTYMSDHVGELAMQLHFLNFCTYFRVLHRLILLKALKAAQGRGVPEHA
jgi:hypothetical protein